MAIPLNLKVNSFSLQWRKTIGVFSIDQDSLGYIFPQNSILQLLNCLHNNLKPKHRSRVSNSNDGWNAWKLQTCLTIITSKCWGPLPTLRRIRAFLFKDVEDGVWWGFWFQLNNSFVVWNIKVNHSHKQYEITYHLVGSYQRRFHLFLFLLSSFSLLFN
jgi:hypothetical protein